MWRSVSLAEFDHICAKGKGTLLAATCLRACDRGEATICMLVVRAYVRESLELELIF